jgi:hypothetical protein
VRLSADPNAKDEALPAARRTAVWSHEYDVPFGGYAEQLGKTALMRSALNGHTATAAELVRLGAKVDAKDTVRSNCISVHRPRFCFHCQTCPCWDEMSLGRLIVLRWRDLRCSPAGLRS